MRVAERQYFQAVESQAKLMVTQAGKVWRAEYWRESLLVSAFTGALFFTVGLASGIRLHQDFQQADVVYQWGQQMWRWNQAQFLECEKQERTTCNFYIVEPDRK